MPDNPTASHVHLKPAFSTTLMVIRLLRSITHKQNDQIDFRPGRASIEEVLRQYLQKFTGECGRQFDDVFRDSDNPRWANKELEERFDIFLQDRSEAYLSRICEIKDVLDGIIAERKCPSYISSFVSHSPRFLSSLLNKCVTSRATSSSQRMPRPSRRLQELDRLKSDLLGLLEEIPLPRNPKPLDSGLPMPAEKFPIVVPKTPDAPFIVPDATLVTTSRVERYLEDVDRELGGRDVGVGFSPVFITGAAGTDIATHYVHSKRNNFPGGVYWISAKHPAKDLGNIVTELREYFQFEAPENATSNLEELLKLWLRGKSGWLIVFDGPDESVDYDVLTDIVPETGSGCYLVTSRVVPSSVPPLIHNNGVVSTEWTRGDAIELLLKLSWGTTYEKPSGAEEDAAWQILGHFSATQSPLATWTVASYIRGLRRTLSQCAQVFRDVTVAVSAIVERTEETDDSITFVITVDFSDGSKREVWKTYEEFCTLDSGLFSELYHPVLHAALGDFVLFEPNQEEVIRDANDYLRGLLNVPLVCVSLPLQAFLAGKKPPNSEFCP
ncbi:MAG: hypothetical protein M1840_007032 [Geoglossum simile]|nr:MAG: hypothetical protein M1840_007032 [Geoglossum simile]